MKTLRLFALLTCLLGATLNLTACMMNVNSSNNSDTSQQLILPKPEPFVPSMEENMSIYDRDSTGVRHLYVTVLEENLYDDPDFTWADLNKITYKEEEKKRLDVIFQEGDAEGVQPGYYGYNKVVANAKISIRGSSTRKASQKSYKIKLYDNEERWEDHKSINLNKHPYDLLRFRNKLSFDYFKLIPNIPSLRTQFVQLHVKDLTKNPKDTEFQNYGLFTQVEQPNESYLRLHGLDPNGQLYKATFFEFLRYPEQIRLKSDPEYSVETFESILEINGDDDHSKLIQMLEDVNDLSQNIDDIVDKYFDRDNYLTWMAANILFDNMDTSTQNFLLYSPLNSSKWFFIPWDYDGAWGYTQMRDDDEQTLAPWQNGLSNYWGSILHQRFFKNPDNVQQLVNKMEELLTIVTPEQTQSFIDQYYPIVSAYVRSEPDIGYLNGTLDKFEQDIKKLPQLPQQQYEQFLQNLEKPMPFFLNDVEQADGKFKFSWGESYDIQGDALTYHFQLSRTPDFANPLIDESLELTELEYDEQLPLGTYYYKVTVTDAKGNEMTAFDTYEDADGYKYFSTRTFRVVPEQ